MKRAIVLFLGVSSLAYLLAGASCSGAGNQDAGPGDGEEEYVDPIVDISGRLIVHPSVTRWYQSQSRTAPSVEGRILEAEEPLLASRNDPAATLQRIDSLPADGTFKFTQINTRPVVLGIISVFRDTRPLYGLPDGGDGGTVDAGVPDAGISGDGGFQFPPIPAGYRVFPTSLSTLAERKPQANLTNVEVYAFTFEFERYLNFLLGLSGQNELLAKGFLFGMVVDAAGNPVAGVQVKDKAQLILDNEFTYFEGDPITAKKPASDLTTGTNGVFLTSKPFQGTPSQYVVFKGGVQDLSYGSRLGGSSSGSVFQMVFRPK